MAHRVLEVRIAFVHAGVEGTKSLILIGNTLREITILAGKVLAINDEKTFSLTRVESAVSGQ
ncbi:MAG: hypothetical protein NPIRA06_30260 [Nitrospirales bacterium]|nr:MAG: hypothetical protein NPIRA06_30260 [Nitrospirales bacterium]